MIDYTVSQSGNTTIIKLASSEPINVEIALSPVEKKRRRMRRKVKRTRRKTQSAA